MNPKKSISILGCGWLGLPLALELLEAGYEVKGSSRSESKLKLLEDLGIQTFLLNFNPACHTGVIKDFLKSEILIVNIPPSLRTLGEDYHVQQMESLKGHLLESPIKKVIYISSTSVYPDLNKEVKENDVLDIESAGNKTLFRAEEIFRNLSDLEVLILRCAGLAGYDRNLVKHFAGKKDLIMGNAPVNLIHRDDVIGIIKEILQNNTGSQTYNLCAPLHPVRKKFYGYLAEKFNYPLPHYLENDKSPYKIVSAQKLISDLSYEFKFPDPHDFFYNS